MNKKKPRLNSAINYLLLITCYLLLFIFPTKAHAAKLYLSPPSGTYPAGKEFSSIIMLDTEGAQTAGTDVFLTYDPSVLEAKRIVDGEIYDSYIGKNIDNENGQLSLSGIISLGDSKGFSGEDAFATVVFVGKAAGTSKVEFDFTPGEKTESNVAALNSTEDNLTSATGATYTITASGGSGGDNNSNRDSNTGNQTSKGGVPPAPTKAPQLPKSGSLADTTKAAVPGIILLVLSLLLVI